MTKSPHLAHLCHLETFTEILSLLSPTQLLTLKLRLDGMTYNQMAAHLDLTPQAIAYRMRKIAATIAENRPDLAAMIADRDRRRTAKPRHTHDHA